MSIDSAALARAVARIAASVQNRAEELNAADGALGDGDLGITVSRGFQEAAAAASPADVGLAMLEYAKAFQRVSSSSYGTLVATAFMAAAKALKGREKFEAKEIPDLLDAALAAMISRGKASLGDKTVLDSLAAIIEATRNASADTMIAVAKAAAADTVETFRDKPNKIGRARMFGDQSIGLSDPGQLALQRILESLPN
jgi:phosphoenolpyruvate---glycerone phosphotransferase subunit DhaL